MSFVGNLVGDSMQVGAVTEMVFHNLVKRGSGASDAVVDRRLGEIHFRGSAVHVHGFEAGGGRRWHDTRLPGKDGSAVGSRFGGYLRPGNDRRTRGIQAL